MVRKILLLGAGKSTAYLIDYLLDKSAQENIKLTIGDINIHSIDAAIAAHPNCEVVSLNILDVEMLEKAISQVNIVISMLPAKLHLKVAEKCLLQKNT